MGRNRTLRRSHLAGVTRNGDRPVLVANHTDAIATFVVLEHVHVRAHQQKAATLRPIEILSHPRVGNRLGLNPAPWSWMRISTFSGSMT